MIQRYIINKPSATVTIDGVAEGQAITSFWCTSDDVSDLEFNHRKLTESHDVAVQALKYIASLYDDSKPVFQVANDAYAMKSEAAMALEKIDKVMP